MAKFQLASTGREIIERDFLIASIIYVFVTFFISKVENTQLIYALSFRLKHEVSSKYLLLY
jgi:hypothetical protein